VRAAGPYLNFFVDRARAAAAVLQRVRTEQGDYGSSDEGAGRRVVVEYGSPNIAKHLGVHHVRGADIGSSLCRIFRRLGYDVVSLNFLGDWGTAFGKLIAASELYGVEDPDRLTVSDLQGLYVRFSADAGQDPDLEQAARDAFRRLEQGEGRATALWSAFRKVSLEAFEHVYERLGVSFDRYSGESAYAGHLAEVAERALCVGAARESDGALIVPLDEQDMPPLMLRKSDGTSLYATRDICAAEHRWDQYRFDSSLYVVGNEQSLYFNQLKAALRALGHDWADRVEHVNFGLMKFRNPETGRTHIGSTRTGEIILLRDLLDEAVRRARDKIEENSERLDRDADIDELAEQVGIGAVKFSDLSVRRSRDALFEWDKALDFEGDTGPYVQYAHARLCSILRKGGRRVGDDADFALLALPEEWSLVRHLESFPRVLRRSGREREPSLIATYLLDLCSDFSTYYSAGMREPDRRVLCADDDLRAARLVLVDATRLVIRNGLELLGMAAPERM